MDTQLEYIQAKSHDFKKCMNCGRINWYENSKCWDCGTDNLRQLTQKDIDAEVDYWMAEECMTEAEADDVYYEV